MKMMSALILAATLLAAASVPAEPSDIVCRADLAVRALDDHETRRILIAAHRGAHLAAPENSLAAIQDAVALGADIVELDVRVSADGVVLLMHDASVDRTTTGSGDVSELDWAVLSGLRLRDRQGDAVDAHIPTLAEALEVARDRIIVNLDLKSTDLDAILPVVQAHADLGGVMFYNGELDVLSRLRDRLPQARVMPIAADGRQARAYARHYDLEVIHLRPGFAGSRLSRALDGQGTSNWINALGDVDDALASGEDRSAHHLVATEPDVIQTDQIAAWIRWLEDHDLRPAPSGLNFEAPCSMVQTR